MKDLGSSYCTTTWKLWTIWHISARNAIWWQGLLFQEYISESFRQWKDPLPKFTHMFQFQSQISLNIVRQGQWPPCLKCAFKKTTLKIKFSLVSLICPKKSGTLLFKITPLLLSITHCFEKFLSTKVKSKAKIWRLYPLLKNREIKIYHKYMHLAFTDTCECHQTRFKLFWMSLDQFQKSIILFRTALFNNSLSCLW